MQLKSLIYGSGAIGSYLGSLLYNAKHKVTLLSRGKYYKNLRKKGLVVNIYNNNKIKNCYKIKKNKNFEIVDNLEQSNFKKFDNIFITTKVNEDLNTIFKKIEKFIKKETLIITPCTSVPFWWYLSLSPNMHDYHYKRLTNLEKKNLDRKNIVAMSMWLSIKVLDNGEIKVNHTQRGFPIKEVFQERKKDVNLLRKHIKKNSKSPNIYNIFFEIFSKSLNSFAFNLIALKYNQTNLELRENKKAIKEIKEILHEGDKILIDRKIKIYQSSKSRINQTLKSTAHTMSMLTNYKKNKQIEIVPIWRSLLNISKNSNSQLKFTTKIYNDVVKKLDKKYL